MNDVSFVALKLFDLLSHIRAEANPDETELFNQLDKFDEDKFADEANLASPGGLDLSNLMDVFHAILAQVSISFIYCLSEVTSETSLLTKILLS